ncbi:hypothetical protein HYR54_06460 [Candidatus Acetothermia bacterium]|nr:hypothetical protein [Candidatus Acetothermia bacterium]MBI3459764.1 hypothetical protein [Candidatus Acetothermia bacterium]MBI3659906.1 hypothetical protein [Candidatus Acetothermia bacterium]
MKKPKPKRAAKKKLVQPGEPLPRTDPERCPVCDKPFVFIVGCHKICACGYMEGCGD